MSTPIVANYVAIGATLDSLHATISAMGTNTQDIERHAAQLLGSTSGNFQKGLAPAYKKVVDACNDHNNSTASLHSAITDAVNNIQTQDSACAASISGSF